MRHDAVIWAPSRPPLQDLEKHLAFALRCSVLRVSAVITPLFHANPDFRHTTPEAHNLRVITLENGDYQQIHNPGHPNFDALFAEWPRCIVEFKLIPQNLFEDGGEHVALLECHDLDTNWDKAGWTTGTTLYTDERRKDRHKLILGLQPWGFKSSTALEAALVKAADALAKFTQGSWEFHDSNDEGHRVALEAFFREMPADIEDDPLADIRSIEDPDIGRT